MGLRQARTSLGAPHRLSAEIANIQASTGGINTLDALMQMPTQDCLYTYNMMPAERGMKVRKGYREWANGCGTGDVRTILNYDSQAEDATDDRLWAVTNEGIYNVTTFGDTSPSKDVTFSTTTGLAGYGVKCEFTSDAADHYMFYADAVNGLHQYKEGTGWSVPAGWTYDPDGDGVYTAFPVADVAFVMVFKQRIWVILEDSDDAWYLPVASVAGQLTKFVFGAKMDHGGNLMGLWTWTVDGGAGLDDLMIGIGRGGDVFVYQGNDPSLDDFGLIGMWFVGQVPNSRRLVAAYGSEMYILSTFGVTSLRDLMQGAVTENLRNSPSAKINLDLRAAVEAGISSGQWALSIHPADGFMQVIAPDPQTNVHQQYVQNLQTKAWGIWEGIDIISADTWNGEYYMGTSSGVVLQYTGTLDGAMLDGTVGEPIEYRLLTAFQTQLKPSTNKRVGFIRTIMIGTTVESFNTDIVWDYGENTAISGAATTPSAAAATWDTDVWDGEQWDYTLNGDTYPKGEMGMGRTLAIAMKGSTRARVELIGWDITFDNGGFL